MTSTISDGSAPVSLSSLSVFQGLSTEGTLIDFPFFGSREWDTEMFQLDNGTRSFPAHIMDGILISKPIRTLDSIVHMPTPIVLTSIVSPREYTSVIFLQLARLGGRQTRGRHSTLSGDGVTSRREQFSDTSSVETSFGEAESSSQSSTAGANNNSIILVVDDGILVGNEWLHN